MKYMGSKAKYAADIFYAIAENCNLREYSSYVEPFVGGANMMSQVVQITEDDRVELGILFKTKIGNDINPYVIEMFKALQKGWIPPENVDEEAYKIAKENAKKLTWKTQDPDLMIAEIGFVGIGCSYSGKWFGGYARGNANNGNPRNYCKESKDNLLKQKPYLKYVDFTCEHYKNMAIPQKSLIYCDPPYAMTTKYKERFEHDKFWDWCNEMTQRGNKVFVSEYQAPEGWRCIWERVVNSSLTKETGSKKATERLFTK